jgi:hypothetical protein
MLFQYLCFEPKSNSHLGFQKYHKWYLWLLNKPTWYFCQDSVSFFNGVPRHPYTWCDTCGFKVPRGVVPEFLDATLD